MTNKKPEPARRGAKASLAALRAHEPEALITFRVSVLSQLLSRVVEGGVEAELGLSSRQWRVMVMLNRLGTATSGEVARATHLDHSQVSRASHELVGKGLLAMSDDPEDRRRQVLSVTATGEAVLRRGIVGSIARQARLKSRLSDEEYATFGRILATLTDEARSMIDDLRER